MVSTSMSDFKIEKILGKGSFGSVYLVTRKEDQKIYAIKTVILEKLNKKEQENSVNEVRILASVHHPNVIGYKEAFWNDKESSLNIVMEYADDGDLQTKIQKMRKEGGMFTENLIWSYSIQMIEGLKALHDKKIMHRDLKSANIFLVKDKHQCKLGDMNVSKVIKDKVLLTQTGTPYYASPEVWNDKPYSYKSDLWSIGCVIYELCALHPPFHGKDLDELYANVCKGKVERINQVYSDDLWKMIKMLLQVDVSKRVDCDTFLKSKLILRKKAELKEKNKEFSYIENKLVENTNNGILLSTIKFNNINEIKSQLPKNKNYNDENIDYMNINNNNLNNNIINNFMEGLSYLNNYNNSSKDNKINYNNYNINYNSHHNKNISDIIPNYSISNKNSKNYNHRNNRILNPNKNVQIYSTNRNNSSELNNYNHNLSHKDYKLNIQNYLNYNYISENKHKKNILKKSLMNPEMPENKIFQLKPKKEIVLNKYASLEYIKKMNNNYNKNKESKDNKERFKTELQKDKDKNKKIKQYNKINPIQSIPITTKRTSTSRPNITKLKRENDKVKERNKNKNKSQKYKEGKIYSYLKIEELKSGHKYKYKHNIPLNSNSITEIRSKTPLTYDKNNNKRINSDIYNDYKNYSNNFIRIKNKEISEHQKSVGYMRNNLKVSILDNESKNINNKYINNYKIHKCSKSISDISSNININKINEEIIKKKINTNRREKSKHRPTSALLSKRIKDYNKINNSQSIIMGQNHNNNIIQNNMEKKLNNPNNSNFYYYFDINSNNNYHNSKSNNNRSAMNINYDVDKFNLNNRCSPIRHRYTLINKCNNKYYEKIQTTIDLNNNNLNNKNINYKKLVINNPESIKNPKCINYNEKNIKKINNKRKYVNKRSYDEKSIKVKIKREIAPNRDLTDPEILMIFNPEKNKENIRNNNNKKKNLNISLNDNLGQNNFLKHIKQMKPAQTNNIRLKNQYYLNNINNSINNVRKIERNRGPQIFNNFYSINNMGNSNIPVKVINVFN